MPGNPLNVIIFSSVPPRQVARVMARIRRDAPEARVCGVLYERRAPKTLKQRIENWRKKLKRFAYWRYVAHRIAATIDNKAFDLLDAVIRFIHAAPRFPNGKQGYGLDDLSETCKQIGAELFLTRDIHSEEALTFVRSRRLPADEETARGSPQRVWKSLPTSTLETPGQISLVCDSRYAAQSSPSAQSRLSGDDPLPPPRLGSSTPLRSRHLIFSSPG